MASSNIPTFAALRAFEAIGRLGGIRKAAEELGLSHPIISRHLKEVEAQLRLSLYDREAGRLTSLGERYHRRISNAISELYAATNEISIRRDGKLIVSCAPGLALHWLTARLSRFSPGREMSMIDLRATETAADLIDNLVDGDIRYVRDRSDTTRQRGIASVELARPYVFPVAAPDLVERLEHKIGSASDLVTLPLIEEGDDSEWKSWLAAQDVWAPMDARIARYGHAHLALAAARAGQGIALGNHYLIADDLTSGRLVAIKPTVEPFAATTLGAYVFRALASRWEDPVVARFRRWITTEFQRDPHE